MLSYAAGNLSDQELAYIVETDQKIRIRLAKMYAEQKKILQWGKCLFPSKFLIPFCDPLHNYLVDIRHFPLTNTEAPRNHAKTTIKCFLIPIFQALEETGSFLHYLNVQGTEKKALSINTSIKHELELNEELRIIYGDQVGKNKWSDSQFVLKNETIFTAVSAGQSIRGLNHNNIRPDYIMVDDLYDTDDINNPESTEKKNRWFWSDLYPARAQSRKNSIHIQGTAINKEDLLEKMKLSAGVVSKTFKAITDFDKKEVLWPELMNFEQRMKEKEELQIPSVIWHREMQNERRDDESSLIKWSWLTDWEYDPINLKFDRHFFVQAVIIGCDPSIGEKHENDSTGVALVIKTGYDDGTGNDYWIHGLWNEQLSQDKRIKLLEEIARSLKPETPLTSVNIEAIGGFKDFAAEVKRRTNLPVKEVTKVPDKISNLENKSHFFENKKVHLNKNIDPKLKDMLKYQLTTNHAKHDDLRDGVLITLDDDSGVWNFV